MEEEGGKRDILHLYLYGRVCEGWGETVAAMSRLWFCWGEIEEEGGGGSIYQDQAIAVLSDPRCQFKEAK